MSAITPWIKPQQQLKELTRPFVDAIAKQIPESFFPHVVRVLIAEFAIDERLTHWFTALESLHILPNLVPQLPPNMAQILMSICSIFGGKIIDSHTLMLVPGYRKSLNVTVACVQRRARKYRLADPDSLQIRTFWEKALQKHGQSEDYVPMQWHLMAIRTMPESHKVPLARQKNMIAKLNKQTSLQYRALSVKTAPLVVLFHKVATGNRLFQEANLQKTGYPSFSYVEEAVDGVPLALGGFSPKGLSIHRAPKDDDYNNIGVGSAAVVIFS